MSTQTENTRYDTGTNQLLWFAGAVGTTVGVAVWAYRHRQPSYWERTKRAAGEVAASVADVNPWLGIGAGTAALGCTALAYRLREPKSAWQKASERADELASQTAKQLRPWLGVIASVAISAVSAAYNGRSRKRAANVADRLADAGSRIRRRLQTISGETGKLYPRVRKLIA